MSNNQNILFKIAILFFTVFCINSIQAQELKQVCSLQIKNIETSIVDESGFIFVTNTQGNIEKINSNCEQELVYSPDKTGKVKQIDIWSSFKVFAFYEEFQEFIILDRFLTSAVRYDFSNFIVGYISNATLNFQQDIWVVDESDFTLKLLDAERKNILTSQLLSQYLDASNHHIIGLKEYQGKLFLIDAFSGILIFDNLGNYISKIKTEEIISFNFNQNELCYYQKLKLFRISLNDLSTKKIQTTKTYFKAYFKKKDIFYGLTKDRLTIYK